MIYEKIVDKHFLFSLKPPITNFNFCYYSDDHKSKNPCFNAYNADNCQKDFNAALKLKGFIKKKTNKCNVLLGIKLKSDNTF